VPVTPVPVPLPLTVTEGATALIAERGVEGGNLTVFPEPGRSERPAMEPDMGRRVGILVIDSLRLLECVDVDCVKGLTVISSLLSCLGVAGLGCTLPLRVKASTGRGSVHRPSLLSESEKEWNGTKLNGQGCIMYVCMHEDVWVST